LDYLQNAKQKINILVAEDNIVNLHFVKKILKNAGHNVDSAENGQIALELFKTGNYDLIVTDIQMPEMDGVELIKAIRKIEENSSKETGIFVLTGESSNEELESYLEIGANNIIRKPVKSKEINELIQMYMQNQQEAETKSEIPIAEPVENKSIYYLYKTYPGNKEDILLFIDMFFQNYNTHLEHIKKSVEDNDPVNLKLTSHKFKGSVAMFYEHDLIEKLQYLEKIAMDKQIDQFQSAFDEMVIKLDEFIKKLSEFKEKFPTLSK
jgi:CheY-like chemotaxis protein/HPt (histidine-containing phosphotransfer) domain-containing protein